VQNEPLNIPVDYPGMGMSAEEQANLIVLKGGNSTVTFNLNWENSYASYHLGPAAVATFRWPSPPKTH